MDIRAMFFENSHFDVIIDKGKGCESHSMFSPLTLFKEQWMRSW
jgi:hypothetical protein